MKVKLGILGSELYKKHLHLLRQKDENNSSLLLPYQP